MGSVMSLSCSKRKATSQDVESESRKRRKICSTNDDDENCRVIPSPTLPDELSWKHRWSFCANRVVNVAAAVGFFRPFTKFRFPQDTEDTKCSSLSLPSPTTTLSRTWKHHVFPSFHGADVRTTVLSHILESFKRKGIETFIDNNIERSKSIGPALKEAIRGSKIAIVLLSKNYASSSWCLDELAEIMNCREVLGQIVMTIFYEVDPTDIKKQTGDFGKAFRKTCKDKTKENIERWRKALEAVATIAGEHSCKWNNEAAMIEKIAIDVSNILNNSTPSRDFDGLVGMRTHIEEMEGLLRLDLDEVRMIGIWGPPGIGKTTIARVMFNQVSNRFQLPAIMMDIRGHYKRLCLDEYNAQLQLQSQMLSQIINQKDIKTSHLGVAQERLKDKKVLLVLDEVDQLEQLDALAKETRWFGPGSRIIITTENLRVLKAHKINHIYKVKFPSSDEAFQIFCMHAFGQKHPDYDFFELAWEVTSLAGELPLGLKVLGSALRGMSKQEWKRTLPRLKTQLVGDTESILKFSYDALCDDDKDLFLYIACLLFTSMDPYYYFLTTHKVEEVLANKFLDVRQGLHVLAQKSLISIENEVIHMHTLLKQFGREISRKQFLHGFAKRQLLVNARDICEVLSDDTTDCRRFIGINLDLSETKEELNISEKALERMSNLQFVRINGNNLAHHEGLHSLLYHSQNIRLLHWEQWEGTKLSNFNTEFLVELNMQVSKLEKLWEGTKQLRNLKWMDLSYSRDLKELPDLSTATNLEELDLPRCSSLVELPSSIGKLTSLEVLNLHGCSSLVELPSSIGKLTSLEVLNLNGCSSLVELPSSIGKLTSLEVLNLNGCFSLVSIPSSFENATNLRELDLQNCSNLVELPSIGNATKLEQLNLNNCSSIVKLPAIENATNLQRLHLRDCLRLQELPPSIGTATNLTGLNISGWSSLMKLPSSIGNLANLEEFKLSNCSSLVELPSSIGNLINLEKIDLCDCSSLVELPSSIEDLVNLRRLDLSNCSSLVELPSSIWNATKLERLNLNNCSSLVKLSSSINAPNLQELYLTNCSRVVKLPALENTNNLQNLDLRNCSSLQELPPSIGTATNLQKSDISGCSSLVKLPSSIGDLVNLKRFNLSNCSSLVEFPSSIGNLQQLRELIMWGCSKIEALPTNINLESLNTLDLRDCSKLKSFPEISTNINSLWLTGTAIKEVPLSIMSWSRLSEFHISYFEGLKEFPHAFFNIITRLDFVNEDIKEVPAWVKGMSRLDELRLYNCNNLVSLPQLRDSLSNIIAENCQSLERLDCSFNNPKICLEFANCIKLNQEARDLIIMHTSTDRYAMLHGTEVPDFFNHRATGGSLTIKLNESTLPSSLRFKACIMLVKDEEESGDDEEESRFGFLEVNIDIMDKQKDLKVCCTPRSHDIYPLTEQIYTFEFEAKEVEVTELVFKFNLCNMRIIGYKNNSKWKIRECGLLQIPS